MNLKTTHRTVYHYISPATDSHNEVRLQPLTDSAQRCLNFGLTLTPETPVASFSEVGGKVHTFSVAEPHELLTILAVAEVETFLLDPLEGVDLVTDDWGLYASDDFHNRYAEFLASSPYTESSGGVHDLAWGIHSQQHDSVAAFLIALNSHLHANFSYVPGATEVHTKIEEVVQLRAGVCQDFAHLMISCCRSVGIPARYVSGYLYGGASAEIRGDQAMHAWIECPISDGRWLGLDPTNNLLANDRYVRVHTGRDYGDVSPTRGVYMGLPGKSLEVSVNVEQVGASVRA